MKSIIKGLLLVAALSLSFTGVAAEGDSIRTKMSDSLITTKVKAVLASDDAIEASNIKVETDSNGMVELSGTANTDAEAEEAVRLTKAVKGVTGVKNSLNIVH